MLDKLNFINYLLMSAAFVYFYSRCINSAQLERVLGESYFSYREKNRSFLIPAADLAFLTKR